MCHRAYCYDKYLLLYDLIILLRVLNSNYLDLDCRSEENNK